MAELDSYDEKILRMLMANARATWSDLASSIGLSSPAAADRVRRLEEKGIIKGYGVAVDPELVGYFCTAFVAVTLERAELRSDFLHLIDCLKEVQECHHIAGDYDYLLKVRCINTKDLDRVISSGLKSLPGIRTRTTIVLNTLKESTRLPLDQVHPEKGE
ncbi:Lrp/AsnC family transcriptional regulator [Sporolactobacillus shoreae]|uniref:Lrp/AsnC family transcriptional regulator n=1 Tax=Sporolactobacillus shoreae TaxID=1465501 RepID=UPI001F4FAB5B|nr:Lrp/AsnC family transcriptional regulator [Sporolactobacillus shoreae]